MRNLAFLFTILIFGLVACKTSSNEQAAPANTASDLPTIQNSGDIDPETARRVSEGRMGDSTMFPFVYQGQGRSNWFEAFHMRFQLAYDQQLFPMTNDVTPWLKAEVYSEQTGVFVTYVLNGRGSLSLMNPYMQVQYISRLLPYCSTVDSLFIWQDDLNVTRKGGSVLSETFTRPTESGKEAVFREYSIPYRDVEKVSGKFVSLAYVPYDEDYFIGFAFTCMEEMDFAANKQLFYKLVESFQFL
jgi:hypothetical protein